MILGKFNLFHKAISKFLMHTLQIATSQKNGLKDYCQFRKWLSKHCFCCVHNRANGEQCLSIIPFGSHVFLMKCVHYTLNCFVI